MFSHQEQAGRCHAALTRTTGKGGNNIRRGALNLTILQGNQMILGATQCCDTLVKCATTISHHFCDWSRADKGDSFDVWMVNDGFDSFLGALHHVEYTVRETSFLEQFCDATHCQGYLFTGFQNDNVAHDECNRNCPLKERMSIRLCNHTVYCMYNA